MSDFNVWGYLARLGTRVLGPGESTLEAGDEVCAVQEPILLVLEDVEEFLHQEFSEFQCNAPGCFQTFNQVYESEAHYRAVHVFSCSVCKKSLPSNHLLDLHIQENHDSFFSLLCERKASYQCFLPTCDTKFWNSSERRDHAISSHDFPPDFRFDDAKNTASGSRKNNKKHQKKPKPAKNNKESKMETESNGDHIKKTTAVAARDNRTDKKDKNDNTGDVMKIVADNQEGVTADRNENFTQNIMEVEEDESVVLRRKNNSNKSTPTKRPISLARLPSPKFNSPQILTRPTSSVSGRRNTISSPRGSDSTATSSNLSSPRSVGDSYGVDTEGNSRSRRSTISSSPRHGQQQHTLQHNTSRGRLSTPPKSTSCSPRPYSMNSLTPEAEAGSSGRKSKIPVLRSSSTVKTPKQFSFGMGIAKAFVRDNKGKPWHQNNKNRHSNVNIEDMDFTSLRNTLPR